MKRSDTKLAEADDGLLLAEVYDAIQKGNVRSSVTNPFRKDRGKPAFSSGSYASILTKTY